MKQSFILWICLLTVVWEAACQEVNKNHYRPESWSPEQRRLLVQGLTEVRDSLLLQTASITNDQWQFREDSSRWSIQNVVTHLALHDALFFREIKTLSALPMPAPITDSLVDQDHYLMSYAQVTNENSQPAPWYLEPDDRWCSKETAIQGFLKTRNYFIDFVQDTPVDLRKYYSPNGRGLKRYRDLHQLTLISIAHAQRHLDQIRRIKKHPGYPP